MQKYLQKCWLCTMKSSTELKPIVPTMREIKVFLKKCFHDKKKKSLTSYSIHKQINVVVLLF